MGKAVLISIRPNWCKLIAEEKKTIEIRKTRPKIDTPFTCYIYCTLSGSNEFFRETLGGDVAAWNRSRMAEKKGMVIGEFVCDMIYKFSTRVYLGEAQKISDEDIVVKSCLSRPELRDYEGHKTGMYGWRISNLLIYDEPKKLSEFTGLRKTKFGYAPYEIKRPPQSWGYMKEGKG